MKKMMLVNRMISEKSVTVAVGFLYTANKTEEKAMLFDITNLVNSGRHLGFTNDANVFFDFDREGLSSKYYKGDREEYNNLLCALQRFGQAKSCNVKIKTIRL